MSVTLTHPLQSGGTGSELALAIEQFSGTVLTTFEQLSKFWPMIAKRRLVSGNSVQFPAIGTMGTIEHTPGEDVPSGGDPLSEERVIPVDNKQILASAWISNVDEFISHFDVRSTYAIEAASAVQRTVDSRAARMIALGARESARFSGTFPSGVRIRRTATFANAYPISSTGADNVVADLGTAAQQLDERNIPRGGRVAWVSPHIMNVLVQSNRIVNRDYSVMNQGGVDRQMVPVVADFQLHMTNVLTSSGIGNFTDGESAYRGDFTKTAILAVGHSQAVGAVEFSGIVAEGPVYKIEKQASLLLAKWFGGIKWLRPEACVEIYAQA
jgi:hypothetical protein